jgi:ABC-2 type transport system ATP-binding protein
MPENIIEVKNVKKEFKTLKKKAGLRSSLATLLSRKYKIIRALNGVSFEIKEGEFVGMIGPNGAGKSTMIKILTGILTPSSGEVNALGIVPYEDRQAYAQNIGVVFGQRTQLWWDLPVKDTFDLLRHIYAVPMDVYKENMKRFTEVLGLDKYLHQPVRKLSLGERMRCDLAASLLHNPKIIFLDEPTIGLDVEAKFRIREFLKEQNKNGMTIILTTHDTGDIEELCPRTIIIDKGGIIYDGLTSKFRERVATQRALVVDFKEPSPKRISLPSGARILSREGDRIIIGINIRKTAVASVIRHILGKYKIDDISTQEPSIEETIRKIYREGI